MRLTWLVGLLLFASLPSFAQDRPKVEVFGGFSYTDIVASQDKINGHYASSQKRYNLGSRAVLSCGLGKSDQMRDYD